MCLFSFIYFHVAVTYFGRGQHGGILGQFRLFLGYFLDLFGLIARFGIIINF